MPELRDFEVRALKLCLQFAFSKICPQYGVDHIEFARHWILSEAEAPISRNGLDGKEDLHLHDLGDHLFGYLSFPPLLVQQSQLRVATLLRLYDNPLLSKNTKFRDEIHLRIVQEVRRVDAQAAVLGALVMTNRLFAEALRNRVNNQMWGADSVSSFHTYKDILTRTFTFSKSEQQIVSEIIEPYLKQVPSYEKAIRAWDQHFRELLPLLGT